MYESIFITAYLLDKVSLTLLHNIFANSVRLCYQYLEIRDKFYICIQGSHIIANLYYKYM